MSEPELKASSRTVVENGNVQNVLVTLSVTFPVKLKVKNRKKELVLNVDQNYFVENLDQPNKQKLTQNFIVKK